MIPIHHNDDSSSDDIDDVICQLSLMFQQEERWYSKVDYIHRAQQEHQQQQVESKSSSPPSPTSSRHHNKEFDIDEHSRFQMMTWCYDVANFCNLDHNTVEMTMNYIDRFMMTSSAYDALYNRSIYQLVCMTSLYTIAKVHELTCIDLELLCSLSQNLYTDEDFVSMESVMLNAIQWHINSPTTSMYINLLLKLIPTSIIPISHHTRIYKRANEQAEYLLRESKMISTKSSVIAYCSLISVLEEMNSSSTNHSILLTTQIALAVHIDSITDEMIWIYQHLYGSIKTFYSSSSKEQPQKHHEGEFYPENETTSLSVTTKGLCISCLSPQHVSITVR